MTSVETVACLNLCCPQHHQPIFLEKKKPIYREFRSGDVRHSQASIDKAKKLLDYQPKYKISEGMDEAIDWYINSIQ